MPISPLVQDSPRKSYLGMRIVAQPVKPPPKVPTTQIEVLGLSPSYFSLGVFCFVLRYLYLLFRKNYRE